MPSSQNKVRSRLDAVRHHWHLARRPNTSTLSNAPVLVGMLRGAFPKPRRIILGFPKEFGYKYRFLHRGLTQLALLGGIQYRLEEIPWLGRKTATITLENDDKKHVTAVIDGSARPYVLGNYDLDLDRVFGDQPRVLFKVTYSPQLVDLQAFPPDRNTLFNMPSGGRKAETEGAPIAHLYNHVLDGAYWTTNELFLDEAWVRRQQQRVCEPKYDLMGIYSLVDSDIEDAVPGEPSPIRSERLNFLLEAAKLDRRDVRLKVGVKLSETRENVPDAARPYLTERFLKFDAYLETICQSRLQYCPKNFWQAIPQIGSGNRTYRMMENLSLGRVCLSSPVELYFPFQPGEHYVCMDFGLGNMEEVVMTPLDNPQHLDHIRRNVIALYDKHLSPMAVARHYVNSLDRLLTGETPLSAWSTS
jgi:hypothetical protein